MCLHSTLDAPLCLFMGFDFPFVLGGCPAGPRRTRKRAGGEEQETGESIGWTDEAMKSLKKKKGECVSSRRGSGLTEDGVCRWRLRPPLRAGDGPTEGEGGGEHIQ